MLKKSSLNNLHPGERPTPKWLWPESKVKKFFVLVIQPQPESVDRKWRRVKTVGFFNTVHIVTLEDGGRKEVDSDKDNKPFMLTIRNC